MNAAKLFKKTLGIAVLGAAAAAIAAAGQEQDKPAKPRGFGALEDYTLLMDYFRRVVGTQQEMPYSESCLYSIAGDDEHLLMEVYENGGTSTESMTPYIVPLSALTESLAVVEQYDMASWNDRDDCYPITGILEVVKFRRNDGTYVRVSTEKMPVDGGMGAFNEVAGVLSAYAVEENLK